LDGFIANEKIKGYKSGGEKSKKKYFGNSKLK
jgi:hypothetical protein